MEYNEAPCINRANRKYVFPVIKWLTKAKFEEYIELQLKHPDSNSYKVYPYLSAIEDEDSPNNRVYVGKSIPTNTDEGIRNYSYNRTLNLEVIGDVVKNLNGEWELNFPHGSAVCKIKRDFLVLCLEDPFSFEWIRTKSNIIPKFAMKAAADELTREYFYVGRTLGETNAKGSYYENGRWNVFNEYVPKLFGKVHVGHKLLYVPHNGRELGYSEFEILCLKPTPSPLQILTRELIRNSIEKSNDKISLINSSRRYLPDYLINFIKYPAALSVGEYMLKGEKLISDDNKYEILIKNNGDLVCKSIKNENNQDVAVCRILRQAVHSIWLHRFQVIFHLTDDHLYIAHSFYEHSPEYLFTFNFDLNPPGYQIKDLS